MSKTVLLVLRGRPGLGHVIPGLVIASELRRRGHRAHVLTYGNGSAFLEASGWGDWGELPVTPGYRDWPGLDVYDHGLRDVVPKADELGADLVLLGGEYTSAVLGGVLDVPCGLLLNPEIFEDSPRNRRPGRLFRALFEPCPLLIPLRSAEGIRPLPELAPLLPRLLPPGPFVFSGDGGPAGRGLEILVANGGGVDFPRSTASYAGDPVDPATWLAETREMTRAAALAALAACAPGDRVTVFSCLGEEWNRTLREEAGSGAPLEVRAPAMDYYRQLGRARVVVSRAGAGFLADAGAVGAEVVLWGLTGHDEQRANAEELCRRRPGTRLARGRDDLAEAVAGAVASARREPPAGAPDGDPGARVAALVDALERAMA